MSDDAEVEDEFFLVWSPDGPYPPRVRHSHFADAERAAVEMAKLHRGRRFYVLEARQYSEAPPEVTTKRLGGTLPF